MAKATQWIQGARPRTLPAAIAPVLAGTGSAIGLGGADVLAAVLCALLALALQVAVNYANDYSDGVRGTDEGRTGPMRLVGSGAASPAAVKRAALGSGAAAVVFGLGLTLYTGHWWMLAVGAACLVAAYGYTGGRRPYGYLGLGEVMVFVFFGLVATLGTTFVQVGTVDLGTWSAATAVGAVACAVLMANNVRDIPTDLTAGKNTLAVRLGDRGARIGYGALLAIAYLAVIVAATQRPFALLALVTLPVAIVLTRRVLRGASGLALVPVLAGTGLLELGIGAAFAVGLAI